MFCTFSVYKTQEHIDCTEISWCLTGSLPMAHLKRVVAAPGQEVNAMFSACGS